MKFDVNGIIKGAKKIADQIPTDLRKDMIDSVVETLLEIDILPTKDNLRAYASAVVTTLRAMREDQDASILSLDDKEKTLTILAAILWDYTS